MGMSAKIMLMMMKNSIIGVLLLAIGTLTASAQIGHSLGDAAEWTIGAQVVYGSKGSLPGVGIHLKTQYLDSWRTGVSGNYYFKKDGVTTYDINLEGNYIFDVSDKVRLYPLAGGRLALWHADNVDAGAWRFERDDKTHYEIGFNVGGGIDYLVGDHLTLNGEVKYEYLKNADWVLFAVGVGYRF